MIDTAWSQQFSDHTMLQCCGVKILFMHHGIYRQNPHTDTMSVVHIYSSLLAITLTQL